MRFLVDENLSPRICPILAAGGHHATHVRDEGMAGATDPQSPHGEDELYYVVTGRARVTVGGTTRDIKPGSMVFVAATVPHKFHDITERLELLVVFGPAEGSRG